MRKIIHVDMDAFFASVEQRDFPALRGRPVAVGGTSGRGVVAAASYEARVYGVHSAMPSAVARRRCPGLVFVKPRFDVYRSVSQQIRDIFRRYTDLVEPLSLDEAFLDVTQPKTGPPSATLLARRIKREILAETGLTASAGVSFNKFLAKVASDLEKPDGLSVIRPDEADAFIAALPVDRFFGVGPVTAAKMQALGIGTGADLRQVGEEALVRHFGKAGRHFYRLAQGEDDRPVHVDRARKSVGAEQTFEQDLETAVEMERQLVPLAERVADRMSRQDLAGKTVTLKVKYHDFELHTRSTTQHRLLWRPSELVDLAGRLLRQPAAPSRPVRLLGVTVSNLFARTDADAPLQLWLFEE